MVRYVLDWDGIGRGRTWKDRVCVHDDGRAVED